MPLEPELLALMTQTIMVSTRRSHDIYGAAVWSTSSVSYRARVVDRPGFVRVNDGETVEFRSVAWVASTGGINVQDRITLPGGLVVPVVAVERFPDESGAHHHVKILCGY